MAQQCNISIPQGCDVCVEVELSNGTTINTGATLPAGTYYLWIRNIFGSLWQDTITIGSGGGNIIITTADFPTGMFNQYAGQLDMFMSSDAEGQDIVSMTYGEETYTCMMITISC